MAPHLTTPPGCAATVRPACPSDGVRPSSASLMPRFKTGHWVVVESWTQGYTPPKIRTLPAPGPQRTHIPYAHNFPAGARCNFARRALQPTAGGRQCGDQFPPPSNVEKRGSAEGWKLELLRRLLLDSLSNASTAQCFKPTATWLLGATPMHNTPCQKLVSGSSLLSPRRRRMAAI